MHDAVVKFIQDSTYTNQRSAFLLSIPSFSIGLSHDNVNKRDGIGTMVEQPETSAADDVADNKDENEDDAEHDEDKEVRKSKSTIYLPKGITVNNRDVADISEKMKLMSPKMFDALMHLTQLMYNREQNPGRTVLFVDTMFVSLLMKHHSKFTRITVKAKARFMFDDDMFAYFRFETNPNAPPAVVFPFQPGQTTLAWCVHRLICE
ncbi:hypothetical protein BSL78_29110 [Apostichopus japonicus]|uniref:Uncharacterized protein n=1 Tax=Stichopus japonicus TaxID=307972 RepID=A0A2G8JE90_STIJA|nr:hypothetical protein BSL78_29110 [Apostichopus japonicus]